MLFSERCIFDRIDDDQDRHWLRKVLSASKAPETVPDPPEAQARHWSRAGVSRSRLVRELAEAYAEEASGFAGAESHLLGRSVRTIRSKSKMALERGQENCSQDNCLLVDGILREKSFD